MTQTFKATLVGDGSSCHIPIPFDPKAHLAKREVERQRDFASHPDARHRSARGEAAGRSGASFSSRADDCRRTDRARALSAIPGSRRGGSHFFRIFELSRGQVIAEKRGPVSGGLIPAAAKDEFTRYSDIPFHPERKLTVEELERRLRESLRLTPEALENTRFVPCPYVLYSPVPYLPPLAAVILATRLHLLDITAF